MKKILLFLLLIIAVNAVQAQKDKSEQRRKKESPDSLFNESSRSFLPVPVINNNPTMKTGFGALLIYFFKFNKKDTLSPPSLVSLFGLYSTNKSYIVVPSARLFWGQNKNRAGIALGIVNVNNDFNYETDTGTLHLVYTENRRFLTLSYSRKIVGHFYLGLLYLGTKTSYKFNQGTDEENEFTEDLFKQKGIEDNFVSSIGLNISFDSRDYIYYPKKGLVISVRPKLNAYWLGSDSKYIDTDYKFSYYLAVRKKKDVLAFNLSGGFAWGYGGDAVPFDGYQNYGIRNSLRGYQTGKYQGQNMIAFQTEYRWNFYRRWGAVFFAGSGSIWGNDNEENDQTFAQRKWLPSAGLGLRFMILRAKKINLRLDYGWGVDGNQGIYFGVMEAF